VLATHDAQGASQAAARPAHKLDGIDAEASGIRKACETVPQPTRRARKAMQVNKTGSDKPEPGAAAGATGEIHQSDAETWSGGNRGGRSSSGKATQAQGSRNHL
jgi:hypothetical protein